jgi:hypothetical protein
MMVMSSMENITAVVRYSHWEMRGDDNEALDGGHCTQLKMFALGGDIMKMSSMENIRPDARYSHRGMI